MVELKGGYKLDGLPTQAVYKKKKNGLYEVTIKDYIVETPTGERYTGMLNSQTVLLMLIRTKASFFSTMMI